MLTTTTSTVYVRREGGPWVLLKGYVGGISLGMTSEKIQDDGTDDGIARFFKGSSGGAESQINVRLLEGDKGQELLRELASPHSDGMGGVRVDYPQGLSVVADGLFHGLTEQIVDPDIYQGFSVPFTQNEPESRT